MCLEINTGCLPLLLSTLFFETESLIEAGAHRFAWTSWLVSSPNPPVFVSRAGVTACTTHFTGHPNSGLRVNPFPFLSNANLAKQEGRLAVANVELVKSHALVVEKNA